MKKQPTINLSIKKAHYRVRNNIISMKYIVNLPTNSGLLDN